MKTRIILLCAVLLSTALAAYVVVIADPLRDYVTPEGVLTFHGKVDGNFIDYVQHGPPRQLELRHLVVVDRAGGTMSWREDVLDIRSRPTSWTTDDRGRPPTLHEFVKPIIDALKLPVVWMFDFLTGTASARTATWDGGGGADTNWGTAANWDGPNILPVAADLIVFNATSVNNCTVNIAVPALASITIGGTGSIYSGTLTVSINQTNTWGTLTFAAGTTGTISTAGFNVTLGSLAMNAGTLTAGASTITVNGNWSSQSGIFTFGTSTVIMNASANVLTAASGGSASFYNLTVSASTTSTIVISSIGISNVLTVNGTLRDDTAPRTVFIRNDLGSTDPIVLGGSGSIIAQGFNTLTVYHFTQAGSTVNIPASTYTNTLWNLSPANTVSGLGVQYKLLGNFSADMVQFVQRSGAPFYVDAQTFNVTLTGGGSNACIQDAPVGAAKIGLKATSGTWNLNGCAGGGGVNVVSANSSNFWISFGSSVWNVDGAWTNTATTNTTDWSAGTGTVNFTRTTSQNIANPNLGSTAQFNNVTFDSNNGGANPVYTITTNPLILTGTLTVTNSTAGGTETLTDATNNKGITAGAVTVGIRGTLTMGTATLTVSGNFTASAGTYNGSSATLALSGSSTQTLAVNGQNLGTLSITGSSVKAFTQNFTTAAQSASATNATMQINAGVTWTHNGLTISGPSTGFLLLRSSAPGTPWFLAAGSGTAASYVDVQDSVASGDVNACNSVDSGNNQNWDFGCGAPPGGIRTLKVVVSCGYNPFVLIWSCADRTNYTNFDPQNFQFLSYNYDGAVVATTPRRGDSVAFRAPNETWIDTESDHLLVAMWSLYNGGTPSSTWVLHVDNRPAQIGMTLLGLALLIVIVAVVVRRRGGGIAWEQVKNPSYRRSAIAVEEYPKGWRSYRQVRDNPNLPHRSERRGDLWIIYQLRTATAAEQARTGRKRIAYVQTVREKI